MSQKFQTSSLKRSLPALIQLGHSSVPENQEQSFNRRRQLSWVTGSCAAQGVAHRCPVTGPPGETVARHPGIERALFVTRRCGIGFASSSNEKRHPKVPPF
jgi:hypothetical protein